MSKYKTTGNQTLFDAENAAQKLTLGWICSPA